MIFNIFRCFTAVFAIGSERAAIATEVAYNGSVRAVITPRVNVRLRPISPGEVRAGEALSNT